MIPTQPPLSRLHTLADRAGGSGLPRRAGIALLVVLVVFVILYLVVYHLSYWTTMEAHVANVRQGEIQSQDALHSASLFVMSLLTEDLRSDLSESEGGEGQAGGGLPGLEGQGAGGRDGGGPDGGRGGGPGGGAPGPASQGDFVPLQSATGGAGQGGPEHYDSKQENIFQPVRQTIGEVEVKAQVADNEGRLDLNRIFDYGKRMLVAAQQGSGALAGMEGGPGAGGDAQGQGPGGPGGGLAGVSERDLVDAVTGAGSESEAEGNLEALGRSRAGRSARDGEDGRAGRVTRAESGQEDVASEADAMMQQLGLQEDVELTEFREPTPEVIQMTQEILRRAVYTVISMNETWGYRYESMYDADEIAMQIIDYVLARRRSRVQNIIYHPSELLNLYSITSELYYGPKLAVDPDEEVEVSNPSPWGDEDWFRLRKDEFGDWVAEYIDPTGELELMREEEERRLEELQEVFGQFAELPPELGVGRLNSSSLTRGMEEPAVRYDEQGNGYVPSPPLPLGLEDIFCTFSTGKVNINTAPVPVLYGLLLSLSPGVEGEANFVAVAIDDWRNRLQDFEEGEGTETGIRDESASVPDLGQPRRPVPEEEETMEEVPLDTLDPAAMGASQSSYQDLQTNYFTNLQQLELVDGTDGDPQADLIRRQQGVDRVSAEGDTLYQRILNDYSPVMVFGSTYFTVKLQARAGDSPVVKSGYMVVKRDPEAELMEVILWKELQ